MKPDGFATKFALRDHLKACHLNDLYLLSDKKLEECDLFLCRECETHICTSSPLLKKHVESKHVEKRTDTNLEVLTKNLYKPVSNILDNHWDEGLNWLSTHRIAEPSFRQSLISKIKFDLEADVVTLFEDVLYCCVEVAKEARCPDLRTSSDYKMDEVWVLPVIFEQLILAPLPPRDLRSEKDTVRQIVLERIRLFRSGQIRHLFESSQNVRSKSSRDFRAEAPDIQKCAQIAADNDNKKSAVNRVTKYTPVSPMDNSNWKYLRRLFPDSLNLSYAKADESQGMTTRSTSKSKRKRVVFGPTETLQYVCGVKRGKAPGLQSDSLDLFSKLARRRTSNKPSNKKSQVGRATGKILATFFSILANGDVPENIKELLRTTYTVALLKDVNDNTKLRPLGIPAAIRRILCGLVIVKFGSDFASYLLPNNFAVGVKGGIDVITTTVRLAVDKFISGPESRGQVRTRALVSLDIKNMFNAISRETLRHIISESFPHLENFADLLYDSFGKTAVKMDDGTWRYIPVQEGFAQGCPISPIFAAIVLQHILKKVEADLGPEATARLSLLNPSATDDGLGGLMLLLAYVDDVNCVLPLKDVSLFLESFKRHGESLGAVMNREKTRILTSTSNMKVTERLRKRDGPGDEQLAKLLEETIATFSLKQEDGKLVPHEVTDGLRVLGVPIGSPDYCRNFVRKTLDVAKLHAAKVLSGLESDQTKLQLYKSCIAHKLTHLFASDVVNRKDQYPTAWENWDSEFCDDFDNMTNDFLACLTRQTELPLHSTLISTTATQHGGLGIQSPRCTAVPTFVLTIKRCIGYIKSGVWTGQYSDSVPLPKSITSLYDRWDMSPSKTFRIFNLYWRDIASECVSARVPDHFGFFLHRSGLNTCRERIKKAAASTNRALIENLLDPRSQNMIDEILDPKMGMALVDMSRIPHENRMKNDRFAINLKRKLRLDLWPGTGELRCPLCKCEFDRKGDHLFRCDFNKTRMHHDFNKGWIKIAKKILPIVNLVSSETAVREEQPGLVRPLKQTQVKPFDSHFRIDHNLDDRTWHTPLTAIGFDVTVISSNDKKTPILQAAPNNNIHLRLQAGEKKKFERPLGGTNKRTKVTLTGDQIIGDLYNQMMALIPMPVSPYGLFGSIFHRFLYGDDAFPLPKFSKHYAGLMAERSISGTVPRGVLYHANKIWRSTRPGEFFGGSYMCMDPMTWANQQFGLLTCNANGAHMLRAIEHMRREPLRVEPDAADSVYEVDSIDVHGTREPTFDGRTYSTSG